MNVSRKSWHYRLYRYLKHATKGPRYLLPFGVERADVEIPSNLCPYFWSIVIGLIGTAFVIVVFAALLIPMLAVGFAIDRGRVIDRKLKDRAAARARKKEEKPEKAPEPERPKRPPLVKTFVRAHKDQVCPTIRLVD